MAIGAMASTLGAGSQPPLFFDFISFAGDGAYPTGGTAAFEDAVQALKKDGRQVLGVIPQDCGGYHPVYDRTNDKLKVYYNDNNNAADGPAIEVPNTTDLSAVTFNVIVISK